MYFFNSSIAYFDFPGASFVYFPEGWGLGKGFFGFAFEAASTPVYSDIPKSPSSYFLVLFWRVASETFIVLPPSVTLLLSGYLCLSGCNLDPALESILLSIDSLEISSSKLTPLSKSW